ncbi:ABC transporter permease subunit [Hahella sp. KA22]|uniref:carbohydrate ABC transporter permease n=1 Tax=Hahella sp. KA22 TaxID=1628392 RepID=UPI000FDCF002|nr:carbohydrate ABC transporter permease [Hahella sp. KA22]AZZ95278.1 carbohydrate ABC transporter permease [Hahella sp. KA22]QAY52923.1 ABC transporter permease subunit [Hahella sp. KA22]
MLNKMTLAMPWSGMNKLTLKPDLGKKLMVHAVLLTYTVIALFPILVILINSFKTRKAIFNDPLGLPDASSFTLVGFEEVLARSSFDVFFFNSLIVTVLSLFFVLLFGAMAAWALTEYRFRGALFIAALFAMGIMIPIRLGTVSILQLMVDLDLVNTRTSLVLVYIAQGLPLAVYILSEFIRTIPKELKEAARCDNVSEYKIFFQIVLPLIRPAMATVAVFTMIPIWNDLWFPLILAPGESTQTITLGVQQFIGQFVTDWNAVLSSLTLAIAPVLVLYLVFSRQLIRGLTAGAVK